jgi:hypothetical protein
VDFIADRSGRFIHDVMSVSVRRLGRAALLWFRLAG